MKDMPVVGIEDRVFREGVTCLAIVVERGETLVPTFTGAHLRKHHLP